LDRALHDLAAKKAGLPLHRFLGATRDFANAYACGGSTSHSETELVAEVESFLRQGFTTIKIKVGLGFGAHPETDVLRVKAIRKNLGYSFSLAIDANQAFSAGQAINLSEKLSEEQIAWFEEPVHSAEHSSIRLYARKGTIPSAFGESEYSGKVFPQLVQNGVQHLQPSPDMLTSLAEFFEISALAYKYGLPVSSGGYSWENCEYTAALNESSLTEYLEPVVGGMRSFMESAPELREGRFLLQSYPGSSIRFDLEGLKKGGILQTVTLAGK
jgi:L-alanine-DL-glutamate epimerase-like enolase superfamily enzyme